MGRSYEGTQPVGNPLGSFIGLGYTIGSGGNYCCGTSSNASNLDFIERVGKGGYSSSEPRLGESSNRSNMVSGEPELQIPSLNNVGVASALFLLIFYRDVLLGSGRMGTPGTMSISFNARWFAIFMPVPFLLPYLFSATTDGDRGRNYDFGQNTNQSYRINNIFTRAPNDLFQSSF